MGMKKTEKEMLMEKVTKAEEAEIAREAERAAANEKISKSWVDIAKTEQNRVMKDVVGKTSESALKESLSKISADLSEQKSRQRNAVMFNVPEGSGGNDTSLEEVVCGFVGHGLSHEEIAYCKRLGDKKN